LVAGRRSEQPDDYRDVRAEVENGAGAVRIGPRGLESVSLDGGDGSRAPARPPHPPAELAQLLAELAAAASAADDQDPCQLLVVDPAALGERPAAAGPHCLVLRRLAVHVRLGDLLGAALSPQRILGFDHLAYVVDLVLSLHLR